MKKTVERIDLNTKSKALKATKVTAILAIGLGTEFWHWKKEENKIKTWKN